jgi:hypothetical protein
MVNKGAKESKKDTRKTVLKPGSQKRREQGYGMMAEGTKITLNKNNKGRLAGKDITLVKPVTAQPALVMAMRIRTAK